ncbi:Lactonase, 7-bladed beta-propeller-domain-containing protein [Hyaloraphidium curvatum]|nr:Lactonase, 7-bladed beta-propeller-domain-containing protein [Hyaloraphidium curvatum]
MPSEASDAAQPDATAPPSAQPSRLLLLVGGYTWATHLSAVHHTAAIDGSLFLPAADALHAFVMDTSTGRVERVELRAGTKPDPDDAFRGMLASPSFLALFSCSGRVYAACVEELDHLTPKELFAGQDGAGEPFPGWDALRNKAQTGGGISLLRLDPEDGGTAAELTHLWRLPSHGRSPCHVLAHGPPESVDGRTTLFVSNYVDGTLAWFPLSTDGPDPEPVTANLHQHSGQTGPDSARQEGPHAHMCAWLPPHARAESTLADALLCADLGLDQLVRYSVFPGLTYPQPRAPIAVPGGPRHVAFHPSLAAIYVLCELESSVAVLVPDTAAGTFKEIQRVSTLPSPSGLPRTSAPTAPIDSISDPTRRGMHNTPAPILVAPLGPDSQSYALYVGNRGHDSVFVCPIDPQTGTLPAPSLGGGGSVPPGADGCAWIPSGGRDPRGMGLAAGRFLVVLNQTTPPADGGTGHGPGNMVVRDLWRDMGRGEPVQVVEGLGVPTAVDFAGWEG